MPHDNERRDTESRKIEALAAISIAIGTLGRSLIAVAQQNVEQRRRLDVMDRKLDRLLQLVAAGPDADKMS